MFSVCKRKMDQRKRKRFYEDFPFTTKKYKIYEVFNIKKRKYNKNTEYNHPKKQKKEHKNKCILHDENYICDIYDCNGVNNYIKYSHMPYIN